VTILRDERDRLVLDPATTADLEVTLVGDLLPGDPRRAAG
jgi:hypothetical protein